MSIFRPTNLSCPACGTAVPFEAVHSVNADRRPDLRADILDGSFQAQPCPKCGETFRLDPDFNLLDTERGQWIAAAPLASLGQWQEVENHAKETFELAFGADAAEAAQEIGKTLQARVTFGWPALREKLLAHDQELDDVTLELCKAFIMRSVDSPVAAEAELRLLGVGPEGLSFGWLRSADGSLGPTMKVARTLYDQIAADEDGAWEELRDEVSAGFFVDINRLLIPQGTPAAPGGAEEEKET
jgi:hypothetical protein